MEQWEPGFIFDMLAAKHRERVARGEPAHRLAETLGGGRRRSRLAAALAALAPPVPVEAAGAAPGALPTR